MSLSSKLAELKALHEQGLITSEVYAERQRALLADDEATSPTTPPPPAAVATGPTPSSSSTSWLAVVLVVAAIVFGGIWFVNKTGDRQTKDVVNQLASQTGIGTQVIPWADLADTAARKLVERNAGVLAQSIQGITHPTGSSPALARTVVSKLDDRIQVELTVAWKGGILGTPYQTTVTWEVDKSNHVAARVTSDSAAIEVSRANKETLDNYFRTKIYPPFYAAVSGAAP